MSHPFLSDSDVWTLACAWRLAELEGTRVVGRGHYAEAEALYRSPGAAGADPLRAAEAHLARAQGRPAASVGAEQG